MISEIIEMEKMTQADEEVGSQEVADEPYISFAKKDIDYYVDLHVRKPETLYCSMYNCKERTHPAPAVSQ